MKPAARTAPRKHDRKCFGNEGYAMEELIAKLGSAFQCSGLELTPGRNRRVLAAISPTGCP